MRFVGADAPPSLIHEAPPELLRRGPEPARRADPWVVPNPTRWAPGAATPRVAGVFDPRSNAIGLLRLGFALLVVVAHSWPLGYGEDPPLTRLSRGQTDLGGLAVAGFFVLSGLLVTRSAARGSVPRFFWHRALRILPGLWVCLAVTAFVLGPALWWLREDTAAGYLGLDPSPVRYVTANLFAAMDQYGIGDLLSTTPYGHVKGDAGGGASIFDGSLWTLRYEIACYLVTGAVAALGLLRRRPGVVVGCIGVVYGMVLLDWASGDRFGNDATLLPDVRGLPLLGSLGGGSLFEFGLAFAIGAAAALLPHRFPLPHAAGIGALLLAAATLRFGGWDVAGLPAFGYAVLWAGMRLPRALHRVGSRHDVSYGVYIYAFPVQQVLALLHLQRLGMIPFVLVSGALSLAAGRLSWNLVERPALRFKDLLRDRPGRRSGELAARPPVRHGRAPARRGSVRPSAACGEEQPGGFPSSPTCSTPGRTRSGCSG